MALGKRRSISTFIIKFIWILFLVFQESKLVICDDGYEEDSLNNALEAIERRQRDLEFQDNDYYGQPENIGYGFQKTLGFSDNGQATELGSFDSNPKNDFQNFLINYGPYVKEEVGYDGTFDKRKSNFRERMSNPRKNLIDEGDNSEEFTQNGAEYLQLLKNLWSKYRESRPDEVNVEDLTDEQVEEILNSLYDREESEGSSDYVEPYVGEVIPVRSRKNYRVFDRFGDRKKRYPSFGEGIYGKRNLHSQNINYKTPTANEFLYYLKYVNPEMNRETVENMGEDNFEVLGDEKDRDVIRILKNQLNRGKYIDDEPYWAKDDETWLPGPVTFSNDRYESLGRNEKREELKFFKNHGGIPVKRSSIRVRKEAKNEKVNKELKGIFETQVSTTNQPKKNTKKPLDLGKKTNGTKSDGKKIVRRDGKSTKEEVVLPTIRNEEIVGIFKGDKKSKKSIDWSQYFGIDKRSAEERWLKEDSMRRAEKHMMGSKYGEPQYESIVEMKKSNEKRFPYDIGTNIERVENRIGDIQEKIIDDAVKYTGAHSGGGNEDLGKVKNKVIQRLEAAYSLEKMKNALEEFKSLIKPNKKEGEVLKKSVTEAPKTETKTTVPKESSNLENPPSDKKQTAKRVAKKKEGVKNMFNVEPSDSIEFLNDVYGKIQYETEDCSFLDSILHTCLRVEEISDGYSELLVPLCSLHQICYLCGPEIGFPKISTCDAMYLKEAQHICQDDRHCTASSRNSMIALRDLYKLELMRNKGRRPAPGSCLANRCIQRYFLNASGPIYPIEFRK